MTDRIDDGHDDHGINRERRRHLENQRVATLAANAIQIPACARPQRRKNAEKSLKRWCEVYLGGWFFLKWSDDHVEQLEHIERCVTDKTGGVRQAIGAPRGDGKTTRMIAGILYSVLTGHQRYGVLITAIAKLSGKAMSAFKMTLQNNDLLLEDYPEVCYPLRRLGSTAARAKNMTFNGEYLWDPGGESPYSQLRIQLPTVDGSVSSGAVIEAGGLLEASRGLLFTTATEIIRPSVVLIDDPQTSKSARSNTLTMERMNAINQGILHLGGPDKRVSTLASLTIIRPGDLSDILLDPKQSPAWHPIKKCMLNSFPLGKDPEDSKLRKSDPLAGETADKWDEYAQVFTTDLGNGNTESEDSHKLYRKFRNIMDRGAGASWEHRKPGCVSAIEYAMRLFIENPDSFQSEMQNNPNPIDDVNSVAQILSAIEIISTRVNGYPRYEVPPDVSRLVSFIDVHQELLYYAVAGFNENMTGYVVDYGTWPDQQSNYFEMRNCPHPVSDDKRITAGTPEGRVRQALDHLAKYLRGQEFLTAVGEQIPIEVVLVDANWCSDVVYAFCKEAYNQHHLRVIPTHGMPYNDTKCPISRYRQDKNKGVKLGDEWMYASPTRGRVIRHMIFDANRRKTFFHNRLATTPADPGSLTLFHGSGQRHKLVADHINAERGTRKLSQWGEMTIFNILPNRDNHYLDCLSGVCTAESFLGNKLSPDSLGAPKVTKVTKTVERKKPRRRVHYSNI